MLERFPLLRAAVLFVAVACAATGQAQTGDAVYTATFDATWTDVTHPLHFPNNPHFSGWIGGNHDAGVSFWSGGELASLGIRRMAEWGSKLDLEDEVQAAIDAGTAGAVIQTAPLWTVPGTNAVSFTVTPDHSLVTLVCMIAPSPDWFVGVDGLDLAPGGAWAEEIVVDLYAWDAGTDSGYPYEASDLATVPPEPVMALPDDPFTAGVPIGTLTFTRTAVAAVPGAPVASLRVFPNPFNPSTTIAWDLPRAGTLDVTVYDVAGRLVRALRGGTAAAGPGTVVWNGRDDGGRVLPAAAYVVRVDGPDGSTTRKVSLVK